MKRSVVLSIFLFSYFTALHANAADSVWFKSASDSGIRNLENGVLWQPVRKPTTVHRYFEPVRFEVGDTITLTGLWRSDGFDGSNRNFDCSTANPTNQGTGISDQYLRCLAGTGDFRLGLFDSGNSRVGDDSCEGNDKKTNCRDGNEIEKGFNNYKGFQVRIEPHLSAGFMNRPGRLLEVNTGEPHNNLSLWTRIKPGVNGLMSDECQAVDHCGNSKQNGYGTEPTSWGPNMPFGEARRLTITATRTSTENFVATVSLNGVSRQLSGRFPSSMQPVRIDTFALTYTNSSRRYSYVELTQVELQGEREQQDPALSIVSSLSVESTASYRFIPKLSEGMPIYTDRDYIFTDIGRFSGSVLLQTSNDDDGERHAEFMSFDLKQPAEIAVFFDARATSTPTWLSSWSSDAPIVASNDTTFSVFTKRFAAGRVTLGGNERSTSGARSMYSVVITPLDPGNGVSLISATELTSGLTNQMMTLRTGLPMYADRNYVYTNTGTLNGFRVFQTRNDAKNVASDAFLKFTLVESARVYVLFDVRATKLPAWLKHWVDTGEVIETSTAKLRVFSRAYTPGDVILGGNDRNGVGASTMYTVVIGPKEE